MTTALSQMWRAVYYTRLRDVLRGRLDASLDWRLVISESDLPAEIKEVVVQLVRRSRLWRAERVDVVSELVAHFQDGLEAGASPSDLVQSFGDVVQTAALIRRAKKRGRSVLWHVSRYGCLALAGMIVVYLAASLWMFMDRPTIKTDYLAQINHRAKLVPEGERAWPLYREALTTLGANTKSDSADPFSTAAASQPGDKSWPATKRYLLDHADALAKLREAAGGADLGFVTQTLPAAFSAEDRMLFGMEVNPEQVEAARTQSIESRFVISALLPQVSLFRPAAMLLANDARRAAAEGDGETAAADIAAIYGISRHCQETPFFVSLLVAQVAQQQAHQAIQDVLRDYPDVWSNDQLRDLAHRTVSARVDWHRGFEGERAAFYDSMQRVYTDDGSGDGRIAMHVSVDKSAEANFFELLNSVQTNVSDGGSSKTPLSNSVLAALAMPATNMLVASRKEMIEMYDRLNDRALRSMDTPLWESEDERSAEEELNALSADSINRYHYLFVHLLMPAHNAVRNRYVTSQGERDGALIGLALELYQREQKKWPESLGELSPRWLPELPVDRITGKPLGYKIDNGRPIVFSVGVDGDDDAGREPKLRTVKGEHSAASPANSQTGPPDNAAHEGDWVIWCTKKS
jgi:hypothetical protein